MSKRGFPHATYTGSTAGINIPVTIVTTAGMDARQTVGCCTCNRWVPNLYSGMCAACYRFYMVYGEKWRSAYQV